MLMLKQQPAPPSATGRRALPPSLQQRRTVHVLVGRSPRRDQIALAEEQCQRRHAAQRGPHHGRRIPRVARQRRGPAQGSGAGGEHPAAEADPQQKPEERQVVSGPDRRSEPDAKMVKIPSFLQKWRKSKG